MFGIFIRYRSEDSASSARRLHDRLSAHFDAVQVFMDVVAGGGFHAAHRRISRFVDRLMATLTKIQD